MKVGQSQTGPLASSGLFSKKLEKCICRTEEIAWGPGRAQRLSRGHRGDGPPEWRPDKQSPRAAPAEESQAEGAGSGVAGFAYTSVCLRFLVDL